MARFLCFRHPLSVCLPFFSVVFSALGGAKGNRFATLHQGFVRLRGAQFHDAGVLQTLDEFDVLRLDVLRGI